MTKKLSPLTLGLLAIAVAGLFSSPAFAQSTVWAKGCSADGTLAGVFCSLSTEFRFIPQALAVFSYAAGVVMFYLGLLGFKKYGDDPSQTPLRDLVMKFVLGAFLISLPLAMNFVVNTVVGKGGVVASDKVVKRPCLAHGSSLDSTITSTSCK